MSYKIEDNVRGRRADASEFPFDELTVGQSFQVLEDRAASAQYAMRAKNKPEKCFRSEAEKGIGRRFWRIK